MGTRRRLTRAFVAIVAAAGPALLFATPSAHSETVATLKERLERIQEDLDANAARIENLRADQYRLAQRINELERKIDAIEEDNGELQGRVIDRARELYMGGSTRMLETLLSSQDIGELSSEIEYAERISDSDTSLFVRYSRIADELRVAQAEAQKNARELVEVEESLDAESEALQEKLAEAQDDYDELQRKLAAQAARAERAEAVASAPQAPSTSVPSAPIVVPSGNMTCPVAGPNSFIDSWGYPRSGGRTHEGTDIMAAEGTPVVAITSGTITYAGYGSSAGNWLILSGRDGHGYWYMHNRENLVTGGSVQVGQQIATVGNTGNASGGAPHVHFEYHPGGGGPVNPYSLLRSLC